MPYTVKEIFYTLQGEGRNSGRAAVFCRFSGCNLWSGREEDRAKAICQFCDTDFLSEKMTFSDHLQLADAIAGKFWGSKKQRFVVLTGGEPLLQVDTPLIEALHNRDFEIAIETNGTRPIPPGIDWVCMSPKANTTLFCVSGDEVKFVYPQENLEPDDVADLDFNHFLISPMDGPNYKENLAGAVTYCLNNPKWRLSLQTHKLIGIR